MKIIITYATGLIFGLGIVISGMASPAKVLNFFDVAGSWAASLGLVMAAALGVTVFGYRFVFRRETPIAAPQFYVPKPAPIDRRLVLGSVIFGVSWGICGICPGGAVPSIGSGNPQVLIFVGALVFGMLGLRAAKRMAGPTDGTLSGTTN